MASKIQQYAADSAFARTTDAAVATAMVKDIKASLATQRKVQGSTMIAAAYATISAISTEIATASDLAKMWGATDETGEFKALNLSTVNLYRRLGAAARNLDVTPEGPVWTVRNKRDVMVWGLLAGKGGATVSAVGNYITDGPVVRYDEKDKPVREGSATVEGLLDLLSDYFTPEGDKISPADRKVNEAKREAAIKGIEYVPVADESDDDSDDDVPTVDGTRTIEAKMKVALRDIIALSADMPSDSWNSNEFQALLGDMTKALRSKTAFEKGVAKTAKAS